MKKICWLLIVVFVLSLSATVSAKPHHHRKPHHWSHPAYHSNGWHRGHYEHVPFRWHEHRGNFHYRLDRVHDYAWNDRFPGLHSYRWRDHHSDGFWYHGRRVTDAMFFYNDDDELVSIGFMHNGAFVFLRDDDECFESDDSFFFTWWHR